MDFRPFASGKLCCTSPKLARRHGANFWQTTISCQGDWKRTPEGKESIEQLTQAIKWMIKNSQFPDGTRIDLGLAQKDELTLSVIIQGKNGPESTDSKESTALLVKLNHFLDNSINAARDKSNEIAL